MYFLFTFPHLLFSLPLFILFCTVVPKKQSWNTCHPYKYIMFINRPLIALLHAVASVYRLQRQYAFVITKIEDDSTVLCGAELELELLTPRHELFFLGACIFICYYSI